MKNVVVLGSTGSLGTQTLAVLDRHRDKFRLLAISGGQNRTLLDKQKKQFNLKKGHFFSVNKSNSRQLEKLTTLREADIIVNVLPGLAGLKPSITALKAGKTLLLGNKESLIAAGPKMMKLSRQHHAPIIPLDSEHNAIYEILRANPHRQVKKIHLPCSGGPFFGWRKKDLSHVTPAKVVSHPRWKMGAKVSVESATLLNKGLEIIEAHYLFDLPLSKITPILHPECLIHGLVEFSDGKKIAYISRPDMREHIENALFVTLNKSFASRHVIDFPHGSYRFLSIDHRTFPGIQTILKYFRAGHDMKKFLRREELLVQKFLENKMGFVELLEKIRRLAK